MTAVTRLRRLRTIMPVGHSVSHIVAGAISVLTSPAYPICRQCLQWHGYRCFPSRRCQHLVKRRFIRRRSVLGIDRHDILPASC